MRLIDADVLFSILHDRMKGAEEWIARAETDEIKARAEGFLSALIEVKMSVEDEVATIEDVYDDEAESVPPAVFEQAYSEPDMVLAMMAASHGTAQRKRRETNGHTRTTSL